MRVLMINGSPRKGGNTEGLLALLAEKLSVSGIEVDNIVLRSQKINHCTGCYVCKETGKCKQNDDVAALLDRMDAADVIVYGSPTYWANIPGLMKDFVDRNLVAYWSKRFAGKMATWLVNEKSEEGIVVAQVITQIIMLHRMVAMPGVVCKGGTPGEALTIDGNFPLVDRLAGQIAGLAERLVVA